MAKTRVYLDNCCFNRPYDAPLTPLIRLEAEAKTYIQSQIRAGNIELAWSYIMDRENAANPYEDRRQPIATWKPLAVVDINVSAEVVRRALDIAKHGIKNKDALHISCAIQARCHYFLTTDKGILKKRIEDISLLNPMDYIKEMEAKK